MKRAENVADKGETTHFYFRLSYKSEVNFWIQILVHVNYKSGATPPPFQHL